MTIFQLNNDKLSVKINSHGAELCSVVSHDTGIEYIWQADPAIWPRHAPHLFPIVGKLKNGAFNYHSTSYPLSQHGFARDHEFSCIQNDSDFILFELKASHHTLQYYPFDFTLHIGFKLKENKLETIYKVFNTDTNDLYFSIGAHPAFNCPLQANESVNDYHLLFPEKSSLIIHSINNGLITKQTKRLELQHHQLKMTKQLFENDALVCMDEQIEEVHLVSHKTKHGVSITSKKWPFFGIWSKKEEGDFVCLEPWYGIADYETTNGNLVEKTGIIKLESGHQFNASFDLHFF
jgi:galactose mutarotase-like enzyme